MATPGNHLPPTVNGAPFFGQDMPPSVEISPPPGMRFEKPAEPQDTEEPIDPWAKQELPVVSRTYIDKVGQVEAILQTLENGIYRDASFLCDQILRDERISAVIDTRIHGLLGLPIKFRKGRGKKAQKVLELIEGTEECPGLFWRMFPPWEMAQALRWSILLGAGLGEIRWDTSTDLWIPRLKTWHPNVLWWRWDLEQADSGSYWVQTAQKQLEIRPNDGQWLLLTPEGYRRSWFMGLIRSLAKPYLGRAWTATCDWPSYNEIHGIPIRLVTTPGTAAENEKQRFYNKIKNLRSNSTLLIPARKSGSDKDEEQWGLSLLEAKADTYKAFDAWLDKVEASISIRVLGHNLSSEVKSGALASAKVSELVRSDIKRWDATTMAWAIYEQVLRHFCQYNFGDPELAPFPEWQVDPPEDGAGRAQAVANVGKGLKDMKDAGAPVDARALLVDRGIPVTAESAPIEPEPAQ